MASTSTIDWRIVRRLAPGSLPASLLTLGSLWLLQVDQAAYSAAGHQGAGRGADLHGAALLFRRRLLASYSQRVGVLSERQTRTFTIITGVVLGVLVTISSVGAGALGVTALLLLYPELPVVKIAGSDIAHAVPLTLVAGLGHLATGGMDTDRAGVPAVRLPARHHAGQPVRAAPARPGAAHHPGR